MTVTVESRTFKEAGKGKAGLDGMTLSARLAIAKDPFVGALPPSARQAIAAAHRAGRAFVFDWAASYRVGELCAYSPDLIADHQEFARAPYPVTWIEMEQWALLKAFTDAGLMVAERPGPKDDRIGFLITERAIYVGSGWSEDGKSDAAWTFFCYRPGQPMTQAQRAKFARLVASGDEVLDRFLWGNAYDGLDRSRRRALSAMNGLDILLDERAFRPGDLAPVLTGGGAGDLKTALCAMLLLIRPNMTQVTSEHAAARKMTAKGPKTLPGYKVLTVKLTADQSRRKVIAAARDDRARGRTRWHEVRGHYIHNHTAKVAKCAHDWYEIEPDRWTCRLCGGKRAWRRYPNGRGSAEAGAVAKSYRVTK